jgi:hypothetical protein
VPSVEDISSLPCDRDQCLSGSCCQDGISPYDAELDEAVKAALRKKADDLALRVDSYLRDDSPKTPLQKLREKAEVTQYLRSLEAKQVLVDIIGEAISEWDHKEYPILSLAEYVARHLLYEGVIKEEYANPS